MRHLAILAVCIAFPIMAQTVTIQPSTSVPSTETRTFVLKDVGKLEVSNINGYIKISAWDKEEAALKANFKPNSNDEHARIQVDSDRNSLKLIVKYPDDRKKDRARGQNRGASCEIELNVPRHIASVISNVNGDISMKNVIGRTNVSTVNGGVALENIDGNINVSTVNGSVSANIQNAGDNLKIATVNGNIALALLNPPNATLKVSTVNGHVQIPNNDIKNVEINKNTTKVKFGDGKNNITLTTLNGSITIK